MQDSSILVFLVFSPSVSVSPLFASRGHVVDLDTISLPRPLNPFVTVVLFFKVFVLGFSEVYSLSCTGPAFLRSVPSGSASLPLVFSSAAKLSSEVSDALSPLTEI